MTKNMIAYYRASTKHQRHTIEVQKEVVRDYCIKNNIEIILEFEECSSGEKKSQKELCKALNLAEKENYPIICSCPDRLTREYLFGKKICENYDVIFCSNPNMTLSKKLEELYFAEKEVNKIRNRTKEVLKSLKENGVKLGKPNATFTKEMREHAYKVIKENARNNINNIRAFEEISKNKKLNLTELAIHLNKNGFLTSRGCKFQPTTVKRLLKLYN